MRRFVVPVIVLVVLLVSGLFSVSLRPSAAQEIGPGAPAELCSPAALADGENATILSTDEQGAVTPLGSQGEVLYYSLVTLPPAACLEYRYRAGAVVLFVQQGTIDYAVHAVDSKIAPEILRGAGDGSAVSVAFDKAITLHASDWVSQDSAAWYTFWNSGEGEAVVAVSSYVIPPDLGDPCTGGCRSP